MSFWIPSDNKYVTEITMKIDASKFQIKKIETEKSKADEKVALIDTQIETLDESFEFLRGKTAVIVSSSEWRHMKYVYAKLMVEKANTLKMINQYTLALKMLEVEIDRLKRDIELVKFRVIPLRKNDEG